MSGKALDQPTPIDQSGSYIQTELVNPIYATGHSTTLTNPKLTDWGASPRRSMKRKTEKKIAFILVVVVFGGFFLVFAFPKAPQIYTAVTSLFWAKTEGKILSVNESKQRDSTSRGGGHIIRLSSFSYQISTQYAYTVDGRRYLGRDYDVSGDFHTGFKKRWADLSEKLRSSKKVTVYYKPSNPNRAVISRGVNEDILAFLFIFAFAGSLIYLTYRCIKKT